MIVRVLAGLLCLGLIHCEDKWSVSEDESTFEPGFTVLENWTSIHERNEKIMKSSPSDRYIVTSPTKQPPPHLTSQPVQSAQSTQVSETDLFLLGAIEKLAYRLDFLEKRLQRTEQMLYQVIAGSQSQQFNDKADPCPQHFLRYGTACYHVSSKQLNWKSASSTCRNLGAVLVEFDTPDEETVLKASIQLDADLAGKDFWTGGLNPGLLWIWSSSAKPVQNNGGNQVVATIEGTGRCLLMAYTPPTKSYRYKGADCSLRNYFICRYQENATGRRLERLERALRLGSNRT